MRSPLVLSCIAATLVGSLFHGPAAAGELALLVHVIDCADVSPGTLITAEHVMTKAFGAASVRAKWRDAAASPMPGSDPNQITVVILSREMSAQKIARDQISPYALATAAPLARRAWIFLDRVDAAARTQNVSLGTALGTVIAHEVAHVAADLPHAPRGIMGRDLHLGTGAFEGFSADQGQRLQVAMRESADRAALSRSAGAADDPRPRKADRTSGNGQPGHPFAAHEYTQY